MKKIGFIAIAVMFFLSGCKSKATQAAFEKEAYQKATQTLQEKEKKNPFFF